MTMMIDESDGGGGWSISADRSQLTLTVARPCVISCNISNQRRSLLTSARLVVLPTGLTSAPTLPSLLRSH